jgi:hypothetical protein
VATRRVAAVLGIFFVVSLLLGNSLSQLDDPPDAGAPADAYAAWLAESPAGAAFWAGAYIELLGLLAMLVFVVALWAVLRRQVAGEWDWVPTLALAAGLVSAGVKLASGPVALPAYDRGADGLGGETIAALIESNGWSFVLSFALNGLFLAAAGAAVLLSGALPRWLGWLAVAFGAVCLLSPLGGLGAPPAILLFLLWVLLASGFLLLPPRDRARRA